jgi:hypothetical protein
LTLLLLHQDIFVALQNDVTLNELQLTLQQLLGGVKIAVKKAEALRRNKCGSALVRNQLHY